MKKILLLTDLSSDYNRKLLKGIVHYSKESCLWNFYRLPLYYKELYGAEGVIKWAKKWGADAIISQFDEIDIHLLTELNIPIIAQNYKERNKQTSNITGDYFNAGVMAANFFYRKGYRQFAYYDVKKTVWMRERGEGYISTIEKKGGEVILYNSSEEEQNEKLEVNHKNLRKWLENLPKPIALFACDDQHALHITELCKISGIHIPNEISVLGVDNDDLLCNISDPKLSSIELDVVNGGFLTGELLNSFFNKKVIPPVDVIIKPISIVTRESTERLVVSNKYVGQIIQYIEKNYAESISVKTIIDMVPMSRRVLEKTFKKETGTTIYQYIQLVRVEKFSRLLITTELSLIEAARMVGFSDYKNIFRIFQKFKNMSPGQYRKMHFHRGDENSL
ncbi:AraC family transcriptional regulator [Galbibacter pacificus]|uniref:DNA-binding transcriptional regulator n=1 Tax=Galbibacter pacificus TaxID=2996052 RepID=A0ABT6FN09_9FLAO|nr:DNA-binding transcriptional regulator [Galbibacter pacificus]MDG3581177.1 DNA-binding transcriptional regulator [Galbibacter pacificus]MDG3584655.1 DNA-binding transcriptional regulator [Galbibacter pacificus]